MPVQWPNRATHINKPKAHQQIWKCKSKYWKNAKENLEEQQNEKHNGVKGLGKSLFHTTCSFLMYCSTCQSEGLQEAQDLHE